MEGEGRGGIEGEGRGWMEGEGESGWREKEKEVCSKEEGGVGVTCINEDLF